MKNLNKVYWLKKEIEQITDQIKELTVYKGSALSGMPGGSGDNSSPIERYVLKKERLMDKLQKKFDELVSEVQRIEEYIESIEDAEIRVIARMRFIENKDWQVIGDEMYMDRTTVSRKMKRFLERENDNASI